VREPRLLLWACERGLHLLAVKGLFKGPPRDAFTVALAALKLGGKVELEFGGGCCRVKLLGSNLLARLYTASKSGELRFILLEAVKAYERWESELWGKGVTLSQYFERVKGNAQ